MNRKFINSFLGVIDAAVNGGVSKYHEVFFSPEFALENPDKLNLIEKLKSSLNIQMSLLTRGLALHGKICPPDMRGLHEKLEGKIILFY